MASGRRGRIEKSSPLQNAALSDEYRLGTFFKNYVYIYIIFQFCISLIILFKYHCLKREGKSDKQHSSLAS